jgi:hypothetical protein
VGRRVLGGDEDYHIKPGVGKDDDNNDDDDFTPLWRTRKTLNQFRGANLRSKKNWIFGSECIVFVLQKTKRVVSVV